MSCTPEAGEGHMVYDIADQQLTVYDRRPGKIQVGREHWNWCGARSQKTKQVSHARRRDGQRRATKRKSPTMKGRGNELTFAFASCTVFELH